MFPIKFKTELNKMAFFELRPSYDKLARGLNLDSICIDYDNDLAHDKMSLRIRISNVDDSLPNSIIQRILDTFGSKDIYYEGLFFKTSEDGATTWEFQSKFYVIDASQIDLFLEKFLSSVYAVVNICEEAREELQKYLEENDYLKSHIKFPAASHGSPMVMFKDRRPVTQGTSPEEDMIFSMST